jgi:drug/metabolite transporter (DMT)-like permease
LNGGESPKFFAKEKQMKTGIMAGLRWSVVLASVFAPFVVVLAALFLLPSGVYIGKSADSLDWMWLMLLAAMMLGIYYLTVYVAFHAFRHARPAR